MEWRGVYVAAASLAARQQSGPHSLGLDLGGHLAADVMCLGRGIAIESAGPDHHSSLLRRLAAADIFASFLSIGLPLREVGHDASPLTLPTHRPLRIVHANKT